MAVIEMSARAGVSSEGPMGTGLLPSFLTWLPSSLPRTYQMTLSDQQRRVSQK